ncbi:MAG: Z1 domain-containing protein [Syntrophobacteraceae bacterium]
MPSNDHQIIEVVQVSPDGAQWQPVVGKVASNLVQYFVHKRVLPNIESANRVINEAYRVLSQCAPATERIAARTGLVCGYVQSGKTASMTAVSALAKDNGYRIIILIAGTTTNLMAQNRERLETHLRDTAPEWAWLMLTNPRLRRDRPEIEALAQEWRSEHYDEDDRRTLFISVMKNHTHLRKLAELLAAVDLSDFPAIIFDDEADQASLNTRPLEPAASSTYRNIETLRSTLPSHTYLQYTATPQAPLLITRIDSLSADFAELVTPGEGYIGGQEFFRDPAAHIEIIPQSEIYPDGHLPVEPPESLLRAMQTYFVGVAAGRLGPMQEHRSMLIHPSKATTTHRQYYNWATGLKSNWHKVLLTPSPDLEELLDEFRRAHRELAQRCSELPRFEQVQTKLPVAINQTTVTLVNSVDGREVPWQNGYAHILVGGEKLGRGYTVKGLTVTYMPRSPGGWTADTIEQRARFFGYHSGYLGYCRVYLHPGVRSAYVAYVSHEEDMRSRLAEHRGRPLHEWRRMFYLDHSLAPTRRNVLSSPYFRPRLSEGWFTPRAPHVSPRDGRHNEEIIRRLDRLLFTPNAVHGQHHSAIVYLRDVFEQILVPLSYLDEEDALGLCVVNCNLKTLIDRDPDALCTVYLMDQLRPRLRRLTKGFIPQLFQGRSSAGAQSYPGDRAFADEDIPTVQIHMLRVEDGDHTFDNVPAVAVRLARQEDVLIHDE